jgi:hypothetical protein
MNLKGTQMLSISEYINSKQFKQMLTGFYSGSRSSTSVYKSIMKYVNTNDNIIDSDIDVYLNCVELGFKLSDERFFHQVFKNE